MFCEQNIPCNSNQHRGEQPCFELCGVLMLKQKYKDILQVSNFSRFRFTMETLDAILKVSPFCPAEYKSHRLLCLMLV